MVTVLQTLLYLVLGLSLLAIAWLAIARMVRAFVKFPMPHFMADLIDNPLRRKIQPPEEMPDRHGIRPGMTVLEVGPGNGTYTLATARRVGEQGQVVAVDIEARMIERLRRRAEAEGVTNVEARVADVYDLPFEDGHFDAAYMIAVVGEIPNPEKAIRECHRVLSPSGTLAFSELFPDPDYPRAKTLIRWAGSAGFRLKARTGIFFSYTLLFEKARP